MGVEREASSMSTNDNGTTPLPVEDDRQFTMRAWLILVGWTVGVLLVGTLMSLVPFVI